MDRHIAGATAEGSGAASGRWPFARLRRCLLVSLSCLGAVFLFDAARATAAPFTGAFTPNPPPLASTVPSNGDENPYGIVTVPRSIGLLHRGDLLVSNFNDSSNLQGTGTTIVQIPPQGGSLTPGSAPVFAQIDPSTLPGSCPGGVGLTTALAVTRTGFVIVGSLPTSDGTSATAQAGCLLVLNSSGQVVETIAGAPINGPWDMTSVEHGPFVTLFVTNVLNDTVAQSPAVVDQGTVVRLRMLAIPGMTPRVISEQVIATGFPERTDPTALVVGPTGLALGDDGKLFVADSLDNRIAAIQDPFSRAMMFRDQPGKHASGHPARHFLARARHDQRTVSVGPPLNDPLGMTALPNGDLLVANGNDGNFVEISPNGHRVTTIGADQAGGAGVLFGLTVSPGVDGVYFVDDGDNSLRLLGP